MDAELLIKGARRICRDQGGNCYVYTTNEACPLKDQTLGVCCAAPYNKDAPNPIPIVEQWLADHPEPKPLPQLPKKISLNDVTTTLYDAFAAINDIVDYLTAKEDS